MEIKEAINVFKKNLICLKQFRTNLNECDGILCEDCSHFVPRELLTKAEQTVVEYFKNKINPSNNPCEECLEPKTNCKTCSFF